MQRKKRGLRLISTMLILALLAPAQAGLASGSATMPEDQAGSADTARNTVTDSVYGPGIGIHAAPSAFAARQMERLDRALVAIATDGGVFVSWRLLGTDPDQVSFHLYRDGEQVTESPITGSTNFLDPEGTADSTYTLQALGAGNEERMTGPVSVWEANYLTVPIQKPAGGETTSGAYMYRANDASVGDLDGDGQYDIVLKWDPTNSKDNSQSGYTGNTFIDAYNMDGTRLWRIDLGRNIRSGAHYTQMMVYDLDGDGKAEVAVKTADGTIDGMGKVIGDADADYRNGSGYILSGPEYFTIFDGETGAALVTEDYDPPRGKVSDWGDSYGNRVDRFGAVIAYLDGERPSLVFQRGYYTRMVLAAYNWRDGELTKLWTFDTKSPENASYSGQGNHQLSVADVDGDGKDEIVTGPAAIDDDGTGLWNSGLGHGDAMHLGDLDPDRAGLELFAVQENKSAPYSNNLKDARTGSVLWGLPQLGKDVGRGLAADIDPRYKGAEAWSVGGGWDSPNGFLFNAQGEQIASSIPSVNFAIWWDGDLGRELLDHQWLGDPLRVGIPKIDKWNYETNRLDNLLTLTGTYSNNDTKGTPTLQADLFGDWREEVIVRTEDSTALRIYSTTDVTNYGMHTLMHDPVYRLAIAWQNTGYNQPPHPGFYLGTGMPMPPQPNLRLAGE
ncbi:rhamnogalacturonan lyase [Paenibacillus zeirhizosphaerae]|nr:rhamnogalacturonan lyase [Paenibacillus sp. P96]